jgi:hypothetical protein
MKKWSLNFKIKQWIAGIGWRLFIWGNETTEGQYWEEIYEQEKNYKLNYKQK